MVYKNNILCVTYFKIFVWRHIFPPFLCGWLHDAKFPNIRWRGGAVIICILLPYLQQRGKHIAWSASTAYQSTIAM